MFAGRKKKKMGQHFFIGPQGQNEIVGRPFWPENAGLRAGSRPIVKFLFLHGEPSSEPGMEPPLRRARDNGFYEYTRTEGHLRTPARRRFDQTRPPFSPSHIALTISHSPSSPSWLALCQGHRSGRCATSAAVGAAAGRGVTGETLIDRSIDFPAGCSQRGRPLAGLWQLEGRKRVWMEGGSALIVAVHGRNR